MIQAGADAYLDISNDKSVVVPWGTPIAMFEGGAYTGRGEPTDSCELRIPYGMELVNRRYVIAEVVGSVEVFFLKFGGCEGVVVFMEGGPYRSSVVFM